MKKRGAFYNRFGVRRQAKQRRRYAVSKLEGLILLGTRTRPSAMSAKREIIIAYY